MSKLNNGWKHAQIGQPPSTIPVIEVLHGGGIIRLQMSKLTDYKLPGDRLWRIPRAGWPDEPEQKEPVVWTRFGDGWPNDDIKKIVVIYAAGYSQIAVRPKEGWNTATTYNAMWTPYPEPAKEELEVAWEKECNKGLGGRADINRRGFKHGWDAAKGGKE